MSTTTDVPIPPIFPADQAIELTVGDVIRIRRALGKMPYGGNAFGEVRGRLYADDGRVSGAGLADHLEALAAYLEEHAKEVNREHDELVLLRSQKQAVREFLMGGS